MPEAIVGRDRELATIEGFVAQLGKPPRALVITGEPGIGKTTLWRETVDRARNGRHIVLETRPLQADARRSFTGLADLVREIEPRHLGRLPETQAQAIDVVCRRAEPGARGVDHALIAAAILSLGAELARAKPVLIAIDDVQWLDRPSARVLESVARRLRDVPVAFAVAVRTELGAYPEPLLLETSFGAERVDRLDLSGLGTDDLDRVLSERIGRRFPRGTVQRIERASAGNPLFAMGIARSLPAQLLPSAALPVPPSVAELAEVRVRRLPALTKAVLLAAASMALPVRGTVVAATGAPEADAQAALEIAETARIVRLNDVVTFVHPVLAGAVYRTATSAQRRAMHGRLADLVDDPEERVRHLAMATAEPDEQVAQALSDAAQQAGLRGAPDSAVELGEWAVRLTPPSDTGALADRTIKAAEYSFNAGNLARARELLEGVLKTNLPEGTRANGLRILGDTLSRENSLTEAIPIYTEALEHAAGDPGLRAEIEVALAFATVSTGDFAGTQPHSERAIEAANEAGQPGVIAESLAVSAMSRYLLGAGFDADLLDRALALEDSGRASPTIMHPTLIYGLLVLYDGNLGEGLEILERVIADAREHGQEVDVALLLSYVAFFETWQGHLGAAHEHAHESATNVDSPSIGAYAEGLRGYVHGYMGDRDATERDAADTEVRVVLSNYRVSLFWSRLGLALIELADDRPALALDALGELLGMLEAFPGVEPITIPFAWDATEALIGVHQLDRAEHVLVGLETTAERLDRGWARLSAARCRVAMLVARGDAAEALALADDHLGRAATQMYPLFRARLVLARARAARALRHRRDAADSYALAERLFNEMGALAFARRAHAERERLGLQPGDGALTPSEHVIARLAATGMTNREAATQLSISAKTIEATLARVYEKMGIHSRAELGARKAELDADPVSGEVA